MPAILRLARLGRGRTSTALLFFLVWPGLLILAGPTPGEAAGWKPTGSLATEHGNHTATLLPNGKVLVAAGASSNMQSAGLYDPAKGNWSATGDLLTGRYHHTGTLLANGLVLVAGGCQAVDGSIFYNSAELYYPAAGFWDATGSMARARYDHTATLLPNGQVLVAGGKTGSTPATIYNSAELYDPATRTWSSTGSMATTHSGHTATLLANGQVLVAGGIGGAGPGYTNSVELYDPATGIWSTTGSLPAGRGYHTATLLPNGQVLVAGGMNGTYPPSYYNSAELYDPASGIWRNAGFMATVRYHHTATLLANGQVLVTGGNNSSGIQNSAELYDPATGTWSTAGTMGATRWCHTATRLANGQVLVAGGFGPLYLKSAELYQGAVTKTLLAPLELLLLGN